jgi:chromosome segregation ATPase
LVEKFKQMTNGRVYLALDLLSYDKRFEPAVAHVFGNTFVAEDKETARLIALETNLQRFNCVTLDGDSYRADGILTGGANQ